MTNPIPYILSLPLRVRQPSGIPNCEDCGEPMESHNEPTLLFERFGIMVYRASGTTFHCFCGEEKQREDWDEQIFNAGIDRGYEDGLRARYE